MSLMLIGAVTAVAMASRINASRDDLLRGGMLAQQVMTRIMACAYEDPQAPGGFGLEADESMDDVDSFDDIDDFDGLEGTSWVNPEWTHHVKVSFADPETAEAGQLDDTGLKRISVEVTSPRGRTSHLTGLVARAGALNHRAAEDRTFEGSMAVTLQSGQDSARVVVASLPLLNEPGTHGNQLTNPGWEDGLTDWLEPKDLLDYLSVSGLLSLDLGGLFGSLDPDCALEIRTDDNPAGGVRHLKVKSRNSPEAGPAQLVTDRLQASTIYYTQASARSTVGPQRVRMVLEFGDDGGDYVLATSPVEVGTAWTPVTGSFTTPSWTGVLRYAVWRVETVDTKGDLLLDEAILR